MNVPHCPTGLAPSNKFVCLLFPPFGTLFAYIRISSDKRLYSNMYVCTFPCLCSLLLKALGLFRYRRRALFKETMRTSKICLISGREKGDAVCQLCQLCRDSNSTLWFIYHIVFFLLECCLWRAIGMRYQFSSHRLGKWQ